MAIDSTSTYPVSDTAPSTAREALLAERDSLLESVRWRLGEVPSEPSGVSDGSGETEHLTVAEHEELSAHLDAMARAAVEEIDGALARLDAGTYGQCVSCGEMILAERLEALPAAECCVECQRRRS